MATTALPVESSLVAMPQEIDDTPAAVVERLKRELELERARVRHLTEQEQEAWQVVANLRTDLAATRSLARTQPGSAPLTPRVVPEGSNVLNSTSLQHLPHPPSALSNTLRPHGPTSNSADKVFVSASIATDPLPMDPLLQRLEDVMALAHLPSSPKLAASVLQQMSEASPMDSSFVVQASATLIAITRELESQVVEARYQAARWQLWCQEADQRAAVAWQLLERSEQQYLSDVSELTAANGDKQRQIVDLVEKISKSNAKTALNTSAGAVSTTLREQHQVVSSMALRTADALSNQSALQNQLQNATADLRAAKLLLGKSRAQRRLEQIVSTAIRGTPLSAWCFEAFFLDQWKAIVKKKKESQQCTAGEEDTEPQPVVSTDDLVRVWRAFQVHCADLFVAASSASDGSLVVDLGDAPVWEASRRSEEWASQYKAWLRVLGADALTGVIGGALPRPFKDTASPTWETDANRINAALTDLLAGFIPATEADFVRFWVLFTLRSVGHPGVEPRVPTSAELDGENDFVVVNSSMLNELYATKKTLQEVQVHAELDNSRATYLESAMKALIALHHEDCEEVRNDCEQKVNNAIHTALAMCPNTFRLFSALYATPAFCSHCGKNLCDDFGLALLTSAIQSHSGIPNLTPKIFFDDMMGICAEQLASACASHPLHATAPLTVPAVVLSLAPAAFVGFLAKVQFRDEVQVLSVVRQFISKGTRVATELTHKDALLIARHVRFLWLPSDEIERCLQGMSPEVLTLESYPSAEDIDLEVPVLVAFHRLLRHNVAVAARLKLRALSMCTDLHMMTTQHSGIPHATPKETAVALGLIATSANVITAPRETHWVLDRVEEGASAVDLCETSWTVFSALQRALETPPPPAVL